jgi:hypothetical protein
VPVTVDEKEKASWCVSVGGGERQLVSDRNSLRIQHTKPDPHNKHTKGLSHHTLYGPHQISCSDLRSNPDLRHCDGDYPVGGRRLETYLLQFGIKDSYLTSLHSLHTCKAIRAPFREPDKPLKNMIKFDTGAFGYEGHYLIYSISRSNRK